MESSTPVDYRQVLKNAYLQRREKNGSYSLRSFARDLDVSASMLSEVMNYKKSLTPKSAHKIQPALNLSPNESELFFLAVDLEQKNPLHTKADVREKIEEFASLGRALDLDEDRFALISDYRHFVAIAMFGLRNFKYNLAWIAEMIGGFQFQAAEVFKRLQRVGMVKFNRTGDPELVNDVANGPDGAYSEAVRVYNRAILNRAIECITDVPRLERDYHSFIFAIDDSDLEAMKAEIREFNRGLYRKYSGKPTANRVYGIQSQLIPYTKRSDK